MRLFWPEVAYIDPRVASLETGREVMEKMKEHEVSLVISRNVNVQGESPQIIYSQAKKTVYLTLNGQKKLKSCKPSADYQFDLSLSCPGHCEYCYLQTTQGEKPFMKVFVNIDDILEVIGEHIHAGLPNITTFESGSLTDPVALDHLTGNLVRCIDYFATTEYGRLRIITKFPHVEPFLGIEHNHHTKFRFSINTETVIQQFEHGTASFDERIEAARKIASAGYPLGFIVAPIMFYENWKEEYEILINKLAEKLADYPQVISFELIQHRFTLTAKELILKRFPNTKLDLAEEKRILKWGPYGKFKYIYPKEISLEMKETLSKLIQDRFKNSVIEYFT